MIICIKQKKPEGTALNIKGECMNKRNLLFTSVAVLVLIIFIVLIYTVNAKREQVIKHKNLSKLITKDLNLDMYNFNIVKTVKIAGLEQVTLKNIFDNKISVLYTTKTGYVLTGYLFHNGTNLTKDVFRRYEDKILRHNLFKYKRLLNKSVVLTYKPKNFNGKYIYEFADPDYTYCNTAKSYIFEISNQSGYGVKLIWRIIFGKKDKKLAESLSSSKKFTYTSYVKYFDNNKNPLSKTKINKSAINKLKADEKIGNLLLIDATPTFIINGRMFLGEDIKGILKYLKLKNKFGESVP